jgi:hypothetical protein
VISEVVTADSHVDACCHADGRVFVNNQMRDGLLVYRLQNNRLEFDREHFGYDFPHGVDALPSANLLAVTNYGSNTICLGPLPPSEPPVLHQKSSVLAIVTYHQREDWLETALAALAAQTRPPDGIVVITDGGAKPPAELMAKFPRVTLLAANESVGPFRLEEEIIRRTAYDGYLIHDADDWSTPDLLARLLAEAETTGAEIIGCQFEHVLPDGGREPYPRPLNASAAYAADPEGHFISYGASLLSRNLWERLGGLANGLRFSGDAEFFRRARHVARLANVSQTCFFHRKHPGSLTQSPDTGMNSPARKSLDGALKTRALENAAAVAAGRPPDLTPFAVAPPVSLRHITGPALRPVKKSHTTFIVGMHRSGTSLTANLLRQAGLWLGEENGLHPATADNLDGHWENIAVTEINDALLNELGGGWDNVPEFPAGWLEKFSGQRERAAEIHARLARPAPWGWKDPRASLALPFWLALAPDARVVICLRNPLEVAHSLRRRGMMSYALGLKLWRDYNLRLLATVPRHQRIIVHYEHFFTQPLKTLRRLTDFCGLEISEDTLGKIITTTKPELRHRWFDGGHLTRTSIAPEIVALYARLSEEAGFTVASNPADGNGSPRQVDLGALAYEMFVQQWNWFVQKYTPVGASVAVVSKGDENLLKFGQRPPRHFPGDEQGRYTGYHPADDAEALAQLATARAAGAEFLALPQSSRWWLDAYPRFATHLRGLRVTADSPQLGTIFALTPIEAGLPADKNVT